MEPKTKQRKKPVKPPVAREPSQKFSPMLIPFTTPDITEEEWFQDPGLAEQLKKLINHPVYRAASYICAAKSPARTQSELHPMLLTQCGTAIASLAAGYEKYALNMKTLSLPPASREEAPESYGATEPTE